jgi:formylglycine-generating enzyme required for sulfatase activity
MIFTEQSMSPYVFISYAHADSTTADAVEAHLRAAGIRYFRDSQIPPSANWDMAIETALRETTHMALLLTTASMPYRKEVHREWFYYDQERKPLYPLYIETCDLHSRFRHYNYIDAQRLGLPAALEQLTAALTEPFTPPAGEADRVIIAETAEARSDAEAKVALLAALRDPKGSAALTPAQIQQIARHEAASDEDYHLRCVARWCERGIELDNRFVNLTLLVRQEQGWQREAERYDDLREVLRRRADDPAFVLLGAPGAGKSTLLRRLHYDAAVARLRDPQPQYAFYVELNRYRDTSLKPREWLTSLWVRDFPRLPPLDTLLKSGKMLLLLDALNEMGHDDAADYHKRAGWWGDFVADVTPQGNRLVFSCRRLDYSAVLGIPHIDVNEMNDAQIQQFLVAHLPAQADAVWAQLAGKPELDVFRTPFFLNLLTDQLREGLPVPKGRAALFTNYVRGALRREVQRARNPLFLPDTLLTQNDLRKLSNNAWRDDYDLPQDGLLLAKLTELANAMQRDGAKTSGSQVRLAREKALAALAHARDADLLRAGVALNVLDEDITASEILFFHQLLQEFFAARRLAKQPNPDLVRVEWRAAALTPSLADTLAGLADSDPLPPLPQTGWEETTALAAVMTRSPEAFVRDLIPVNLPLAARIAAAPDSNLPPALISDIQQALIAGTQDMSADLRARIAAGLALGALGDPRFVRHTGAHGDYLLPPLATIPAGTYPIGDDEGGYDNEKPAHTVPLAAFQIGVFPVTNAEYACFIAAGGYDDEQWWDTDGAKAWRRGEGTAEVLKQSWRDTRKLLEGWTDEGLRSLVTQRRITSIQADNYITIKNWNEQRFEDWLKEQFSGGRKTQPEYWEDVNFNNPAQPVVGVCWYEARAYCAWLSAQALTPNPSPKRGVPLGEGLLDSPPSTSMGASSTDAFNRVPNVRFRLPTEVEFEAAARGLRGRAFPYDGTFDSARCNTFESHIRRTAPVGIFANATPEGVFDLSGNAYTWTSSLYDQDHFPYPYRPEDGREDPTSTDVLRVLRGGSWNYDQGIVRSASRFNAHPAIRFNDVGFRVVCVVPHLFGR